LKALLQPVDVQLFTVGFGEQIANAIFREVSADELRLG